MRTLRRNEVGEAGTSLLEVMLLSGLLITLTAMAIPAMQSSLDEARVYAAARYLAGRFAVARIEAVKRSANVAFRFERHESTYRYRVYVDGNGNGVRTSEIVRGTDRALGPLERLEEQFAGVRFGVIDDLAAIDAGDSLGPRADPVRLGRADMISFSPTGSATSGTVYLRGPCSCQYAVRVLGVTGRTRVLEFQVGTRQWVVR